MVSVKRKVRVRTSHAAFSLFTTRYFAASSHLPLPDRAPAIIGGVDYKSTAVRTRAAKLLPAIRRSSRICASAADPRSAHRRLARLLAQFAAAGHAGSGSFGDRRSSAPGPPPRRRGRVEDPAPFSAATLSAQCSVPTIRRRQFRSKLLGGGAMATAAIVGVATGAMKPVLDKLTKLLEEKYTKIKSVRKDIEFLRDELRGMSATLEMLADEEELDPVKKEWRDKLRDLSYDVEDFVDTFKTRLDHVELKDFEGLIARVMKLKQRSNMANEIKELKKRAIDVSEWHKRYKFVPSAHNSSTFVDPRLSALYEDIRNLVAIDGPKKDIIDLLKMETVSSTEVQVVSIYGCGGLGKTTLANQVYQSIKSQYDCSSAFVSVSQNPNWIKILREIAKGVGITANTLEDDVKQLIDKIREYLQDKRYFIVIDDIWEAKDWEPIKLALLNNNCGSRIITTTRSTKVADITSSQGGYEMKPLSFEYSKKLFFKRAFSSENSDYSHLKDVPDRILRKCDGLPLAIITVASMLTDQHAKCKWDKVLNEIGSALTKNPDAEKMTSILSLSYTSMPHHLRTCLLYLGLFPEDYIIKKQCLINRWIAEGFIQKKDEQSAYETGESYYNELINRCMIQPVNVKYEQAKACRVHDIILDYIKCKAAAENFVVSLDASKNVYTSEYKARRLCVSNRDGKNGTICAGLNLSHIRSLAIFGLPMQTSFEPFTVLRVLDLSDCEEIENKNLASIEKLFHLKYLCLRSWLIAELPEKIGELQHLQTLDVQGTRIKELPLTITKLQRLSHLYVDFDVTFPNGMIVQMHNLEELSQYGIESYEQVMPLQEFSKLTKLKTLQITWDFDYLDYSEIIRQSQDICSYVGILLSSCDLHNLSIKNKSHMKLPLQLDSWNPSSPCNLRKLCFKDCAIHKMPNWMGSLGSLQLLHLTILCVRLEDVEILGAIPSLLFLKLHTAGGTGGRIVVHGGNGFRSLKYFSLEISCCGTALEFEAGSMPKLEHVKLELHVHKMACLNGASSFGIQHLSALRKVEVKIKGDCSSDDSNYDLTIDTDDRCVRHVASAIVAAVESLPNRPTLSFNTKILAFCCRFQCVSGPSEFHLRGWNQEFGGAFTEWLKVWRIEEKWTGKRCSCFGCKGRRLVREINSDKTDEEDDTDEVEE
ncbi:hypothetical protein ACP70R_003426 [Stipagrostis hirtigluma subsp. patula]